MKQFSKKCIIQLKVFQIKAKSSYLFDIQYFQKMENEGIKYISLKEASKIAGCTPEHLNLMSRKKKIKAVKLGRNWYTTREWVAKYLENGARQKKGENKETAEKNFCENNNFVVVQPKKSDEEIPVKIFEAKEKTIELVQKITLPVDSRKFDGSGAQGIPAYPTENYVAPPERKNVYFEKREKAGEIKKFERPEKVLRVSDYDDEASKSFWQKIKLGKNRKQSEDGIQNKKEEKNFNYKSFSDLEKEKEQNRISRDTRMKFFRLAMLGATTLIVMVFMPMARYAIYQNAELEKNFEGVEETTFFNDSEGLVKGEETQALSALERSVVLASENFQIKQIQFGGDVMVIDDEDKELEIQNVRSETFLVKNKDESKLVIIWQTNKAAVSEILFSKNNGQGLRNLKESGYGRNHGVVIAGLDLDQAYVYQIIARDRWGNEKKSGNFAVYSGKKAVSVIDLIMKEMEKMFGWAKIK